MLFLFIFTRMKTRYFILALVVCTGVFLFSCKRDTVVTPPDLGYNYYPGTIKSYVVYDVDSIAYRQLPKRDTGYYKFQIKEVMDSLITDNENRPTIKLIRYRKNYSATIPYSQMTWTLQNVWVANKTTTDAEVVENNVRYTKLAFPAALHNSWNGTAKADTTAQLYTYTAFDAPLTLNGNSFTKTLRVMQSLDTTNALYYQYYYEQYARGVGLIYKQIVNYTYFQDAQGAHKGDILGGLYYTMTVNSYGTE
jgi:hypothetical protein